MGVFDSITKDLQSGVEFLVSAGFDNYNSMTANAVDLLKTDPQNWMSDSGGNSGAWNIIVNTINPAFVAISSSLVVIFYLIGFCMECSDIKQEIRFETVLNSFFKLCFAEWAVTNSIYIVKVFFSLADFLTSRLGSAEISMTYDGSAVESYIASTEGLSLIIGILLGAIFWVAITVIGMITIYQAYIRFFKVLMCVPFGTLALSTIAGNHMVNHTAVSWIRYTLSVVLEAVTMLIALKLGALLMSSGAVDVSFFDPDDYRRFIQLVAVKNQQNLSAINALPIFTDTRSNDKFRLRFDIRSDLLVTNEIPCMHIRKIPKKKYTMDILQDKKMMTKAQKEYLIDKAKNSSGILFVGKNASGKTYLMNALLEHIPHENSVIICQESDELFSNSHPDLLCTHILRSNGEGKISYGLDKLAENALVSDNDYIIVGEIKSGSEAREFSKCSYTGMVCWTSVHGYKDKGMYKLADYVKLATGYEYDECLKQLEGIETIVFLKEFMIQGIYENKGWNSKKMDLDIEEVIFRTLNPTEADEMFL